MADNKIANAIKFLKGEEKSLPAAKTEGQVYFAYKNVGTAEKPSYTGAIYIDTPIGGTQNRIKMTANADIADKAFNDSAGLNIRDTYLSSLGYTDDGKQTILIKGSGNNQTRIELPIASTTKSGIVTTDAQSFNGTKTFTTINSTNLTVTGSNGFNYSSIGAGTVNVARPVWFADNSGNGKPVVNTNFTYNPATQTLSVANLSGTADKANKDNAGNDIRSTYISNITINNDIMTITKGSGATSTLSIKDKLYSGNKITTKDDLDNFIETNVFKFGHIGPIEGYNGLEKNDGIILSGSWKSSANYGHQIYIDDNGYALRHRYKDNGNWSDWASILDSTNYNSYAPTKAGGGAYGTWDINILGNAASATKAINDDGGQNIRSTYVKYKSIKFNATADKVYLLEGNGAGSVTATSGSNISTAIIPAATDKAAGVITAAAQTFSGDKTFNNSIIVNDCLVSKAIIGTDKSRFIILPRVPYSLIDSTHNTSTYFKALLKWICANYPNKKDYSFIGLANPNNESNVLIHIYDTGAINAEGYPEYSTGLFKYLGGALCTFGTVNYNYYCRDTLMTNDKYAGSASSGGAAISANKLNTNAGSSTQPIYFSGGKPVACAYTLSKSVPADAKFTDTDTWRPLGTTGDTACAGNDSRLSNARPASDVYSWAKASTKPSYSWEEITGKPSTFTPSSHTHNKLDSLGNIKAETGKTSQSTSGLSMQQAYNNGYPVSYGNVLNLNGQGQGQILVSWAGNGSTPASKMYFRGKTDNNAGDWSSWNEVIDSSNIGSQSVNYATNAATATKLQTARTISLTGSVTGSGTFDGSGNLSIITSTNHSHSQYLPLAGGTMTGSIGYGGKGYCYIGSGTSDAANMVGGGFNNLVISSWWGISFTTSCSSAFLNKNAVSIDCRNGVLAAASLRVGNGSGSTIDFCTNGGTANPGAKIVAYNDRIEFVFA